MNKRSGRLGPAVRLLPVLSLGLGLVITGAIALNGCGEVISRPTAIPPTFTPVLPPDYKTPTPIPPEHRQFFISMGNGGAGDPAITPTLTVSDPAAPAITKADVEQFVMSHPMRGGEVTISDEPGYTITNTQLTTLGAVRRTYFSLDPAENGWQDGHSPDTPVYLVELKGRFGFWGGPAPGRLGIYEKGVEVFDAHTGDVLLEGGIGWVGQ